jgi:glycosyltransferase involved in cell wall biosynthesis
MVTVGQQPRVAAMSPQEPLKMGSNLIGRANADLGMGELVRMAATALHRAQTPHGIINFTVGVTHTQHARAEGSTYLPSPSFRSNIFLMNVDQMWLVYEHLGSATFRNRYNIGYFPWELARCPPEFYFGLQLVDEIWAPSTFVRDSFSRYFHRPVLHMPECVELPAISQRDRSAFAIPRDTYAFLCMFDCKSYMCRKNPQAAIKAFQRAFNHNDAVRLVLKIMNADRESDYYRELQLFARSDHRILLIDQNYSRAEVLALISVCDALVSLHRSEGFGRAPAEAMYLGKPVVVTNYSGNTDFTRDDNSCLVNYHLVPVGSTGYPYAKGQVWAEPDVAHAAFHMKRLAESSTLSRTIGLAGQKTIHEEFNPVVVGARYRDRLAQLGLL